MTGGGHRAFSAETRESNWRALGEEIFDLLVVGGGITGTGVARDAAGRGLRVAVVEAGDVAAGTSSRSSRLVHGGLRYLETLDFGLVFEALRERRRLLELAPHLVHPLPFLFPVYRGDATGLIKLGAGMLLYETLSQFRSPRRHRMLGRAGALEAEPGLRSEQLSGGALYYDAQVDDARLTIAVARGAHAAGAVIVTHAQVVYLCARKAEVGTARVRDSLSGGFTEVRARLILNASGPWSDRVRRMADPDASPRLRTTKGVHILVPQRRVGNRNAVIFRSAVDDRVMFVLPWGEFTYVGTTDTEFDGDPGNATAEAEDIRYLLDSANAIFPAARLVPADVLSTWTGVRPLLAPPEAEGLSESETSREHAIWRDPSGLLNVAGGKLTTFRSMAAEAAKEAAAVLESEFDVRSGDFYTEYLPLPGAPVTTLEAVTRDLRARAAALGVGDSVLTSLVGRHGSEAGRVLDLIEETRGLASRPVPRLNYIWAEAVHAVREEMALTLEDVLRRRMQIFYETADGGTGIAAEAAALIADEAGIQWGEDAIDDQIRAYGEAVQRTRPHRT